MKNDSVVGFLRSIDAAMPAEDLEKRDKHGNTRMLDAAALGRAKGIAFLIERGASIHITDRKGFTPLHLAAISGKTDAVRLLLENGADIHAKNQFGATPLMVCRTNHLEVIELLLQHGADPYEKNNAGVCAYDAFARFPNIIELFDRYDQTPPAENSD